VIDRISRKQRSSNMAAVRSRDTLPERYVRKKLFAAGYRYRLHSRSLIGKPDIVLPRFRTVVFVHGCFWHGHYCSRGKRPKSNVEFWSTKIDGNVSRDQRNRAALKSDGWVSIVVWQCQLARATNALLLRLGKLRSIERS